MLANNLEKVFKEIENGNNLGEKITLVGATKTVSVETINKAISLGLTIVGDNKVQEFNEKSPFIKGADFHFIGHLQTNKVKYLVGKVSLIHSVDSLHLAKEISNRAKRVGVIQEILVEVNIGGELSKSGISPINAFEIVKEISGYENLKVVGLMAMLPKSDDETTLKNLCLQMRSLYDTISNEVIKLKHLSIGMSGDYLIAIKNGSNMIRLGSSIFGKRDYQVDKE